MSKKRIPKLPALKQAPKNADTDPLRYDGPIIALGKARAAWWLLDEIAYGDLVRPASGPLQQERESLDEVTDWLVKLALDALHDALDEAEAAYRKSRDAEPGVAA